ncbi:MAG: damage-inducible protein DinB [Acidobacteriia bacterium]|nr:damage-inducible protein DinB [Terriglobia bacterium]
MKLTELFLAELEREAAGTRRTLERVPEGHNDWKPHEKSMPLGYLAALVARMPAWAAMMVQQDELDMAPKGSSKYKPHELNTNRELLQTFDESVIEAREALQSTTDEHLMTPWRFLVAGKVVSEQPRHIMLRDAVFNHLAHHRGQLTVYLRLNSALVPAIYGPSADEGRFDQ